MLPIDLDELNMRDHGGTIQLYKYILNVTLSKAGFNGRAHLITHFHVLTSVVTGPSILVLDLTSRSNIKSPVQII